jgi:hypothetical protein
VKPLLFTDTELSFLMVTWMMAKAVKAQDVDAAAHQLLLLDACDSAQPDVAMAVHGKLRHAVADVLGVPA